MEKKTVVTSCAGEGCHGGCLHSTHVEDGKIVKIERLIYHDGQQDTICLKGVAGARFPYNSDRLRYPLKRAGKRGEGKWERITWEQALNEISDKLKQIRAAHGPQAIGIMPGPNSMSPFNGIQHLLGKRLMNLMQATNLDYTLGIDSNSYFADYFSVGSIMGNYQDPDSLVEGKTKYMIAWGTNPAEMAPRFWGYIREAQKNGAKLVDIGLLFDPTAKAADWWIPVQAGSDGALALAMIDVIIKEKLYEEDYIGQYTNGPFLVRTDNGKLLRESDISPEGSDQNYLVWDTTSGRAQAITPRCSGPDGMRPALLGTYTQAMVECKPAFQLLTDLAEAYPPEKAAGISNVSAATIRALAREYATTKPAAILVDHGLRYLNSGNAHRAINALGAITGNIGMLGGGTIRGLWSSAKRLVRPNQRPILQATAMRASSTPLSHLLQAITKGKPYTIKAWINYCWNFVHTYPNPRRWIEEVLPKLDLLVVNDIFLTATAEYGDYVLPDCTLFEREDVAIGNKGHIVYLEKSIDPLYECRPPIYFWSEIARRLGFGGYFDKTLEEWVALWLDSTDPSIAGIQPPLSVERLKKEKIVRANVPGGVSNRWSLKKFMTPSGRLEFYNEDLIPAGDALPVFREQLESPRSALAEQYPLVFNTTNNRHFMHSMFANDPKMLEQYMKEPHLRINNIDAQKRNIADGDVVSVYNDRGSFKVKARICEDVPAGVVHIPHGWWPKQFIEGHLQNIVPSLATPEIRDKAREIYWSLSREREEASPIPILDSQFAYSPDTIFDCLCEVKRAEQMPKSAGRIGWRAG